ncbi:PREDICTED: NFAT activation molecule 1 isoform X1 [Dipodomys ordii]|uniref:NFAT activation molecule 1 isoform X1 n=1 Tax=Dipodomys ordii TaxID=10020 RepID=A0A1S3FWT0_DIPOR|nr:PREDICTED: NFAT activation molecule 1 isoform X1 [Dipodomys ordii]
MESCPPRSGPPAGLRSWPGCLRASGLPGWLLASWALQLAGGQSITHTGQPIVVSLANRTASFSCSITYQYTPQFRHFHVTYFQVDLEGRKSKESPTGCQPSQGIENRTYTLDCQVTPPLPNALATGTYYCCSYWPSITACGNGTFILVRDTGYQEPPPSPQKALLFSFTGLLATLSVLLTALLLWKKKQMLVPLKCSTHACPDPRPASRPTQPPEDSLYTALQRRETEVYSYIESKAGSLPSAAGSPPSQKKLRRQEDKSEFNLVYENL